MPTLAGWLTGEQVSQDIIEHTLTVMGDTLARSGGYSGQPARAIQPGAGLTALSDTAYVMQRNDEPPLLDWVPARRTMVYRRPLSGMHPLYYIEDWPAKGNLLFASEMKALFAVGVPRKLHLAALDTLLRYGFIPAPWTAFQGISIVPAGSILRWQRAKTVLNAHTDYDDKPLSPVQFQQQLQEQFAAILAGQLPPHDQLALLMGSSVPSLLATFATSQHLHPMRTPNKAETPFTIATYGYTKNLTQKAWKEMERFAAHAQQPFLAITGVDQAEFWTATLSELEAPTTSTRALALHQLLHTVASETGARVVMSGLGANTLLGTTYQSVLQQQAKDSEISNILHWYAQTLAPPIQATTRSLWSQERLSALQQAEVWEETLHARKLARKASQYKDRRQSWRYLDVHLRLPDAIVHAAQQIATQEHMAMRSPYLHHELVSMMARLPVTLEHGQQKEDLLLPLLRTYLPTFTNIDASFPLLAPTNSLLLHENSELLQQTLSPEALRKTGLFDVEAVRVLREQKEVSRELVFVFTTQLLCQLFGVEV